MKNDTTNEQLSALMDGELPRDELRFLLRRFDGDAALARRWSRYQVASAVFRHEPLPLADGDRFVAAVMDRLGAEPMPAAGTRFGMRLLRWAGGGAIAASVAVAALVLSRPPVDSQSTAGNSAVAAVAAAPVAPSASVAQVRTLPQQLLPAFADYDQPASFGSIVPSYAPHYPAGQLVNGGSEGFVPYVLVVGSRQVLEQQPGARQDTTSRPPQ